MLLALQEREAQGFQHIRLTSTAEDWEVLQKLYDLQLKALKTSATGNIYDLDKWYAQVYRPFSVFECRSKLCCPILMLFSRYSCACCDLCTRVVYHRHQPNS